MVRVDTTLSFAIKPVISAVDTRQSPKPSGANNGAMPLAIQARMLSCATIRLKLSDLGTNSLLTSVLYRETIIIQVLFSADIFQA